MDTPIFDEEFWSGVRSGAARVRQLALSKIADAEEELIIDPLDEGRARDSERNSQPWPRWIGLVATVAAAMSFMSFLLIKVVLSLGAGLASPVRFPPPLIKPTEPEHIVRAWADFSHDGRLLATGGGNMVRLWDVPTDRPAGQLTLTGGTGPVSTVAFSPDGRTLATGGGDTVRLWDVASRQALGQGLTGTGPVSTVAFSPDGRTLATGGGDTVRLWDVASRQALGQALTGTGPVSTVAFSPDGRLLASVRLDTSVQLDINGFRPETSHLLGPQ
jgi:dipeptidyl aminopeptidase/acylaminoacyl peptidase